MIYKGTREQWETVANLSGVKYEPGMNYPSIKLQERIDDFLSVRIIIAMREAPDDGIGPVMLKPDFIFVSLTNNVDDPSQNIPGSKEVLKIIEKNDVPFSTLLSGIGGRLMMRGFYSDKGAGTSNGLTYMEFGLSASTEPGKYKILDSATSSLLTACRENAEWMTTAIISEYWVSAAKASTPVVDTSTTDVPGRLEGYEQNENCSYCNAYPSMFGGMSHEGECPNKTASLFNLRRLKRAGKLTKI